MRLTRCIPGVYGVVEDTIRNKLFLSDRAAFGTKTHGKKRCGGFLMERNIFCAVIDCSSGYIYIFVLKCSMI